MLKKLVESAYIVQDQDVACSDGAKILVRCIIPVTDDPEERFPLYFNIHGGGEWRRSLFIGFLIQRLL